jgi:hypothetical protein
MVNLNIAAKKCVRIFSENLQRHHSRGLGVDKRIILKQILEK